MKTGISDSGLLSLVRELCDSQRSAVLATLADGRPYLSLMAFAATPDLTRIVVATDRHTRKFANMQADPRVALLMDNRTNTALDTEAAVAVTVLGRAEEAAPEEREDLLALFLGKHPHLQDFATSPTCALMVIRVDTCLVVQRFQEVHELKMT